MNIRKQLISSMEKIKHERKCTWAQLYHIIEANGGPSEATIKRLQYCSDWNSNEATYKELKKALEKIMNKDSNEKFYNPIYEDVIEFLNSTESSTNLLQKKVLKDILKSEEIISYAYEPGNYLPYKEWLYYSEYNHALLEPITKFDFSPPNESVLRTFLEDFDMPINYDYHPPNRMSINSGYYYEKIKFSAYLRSTDDDGLWVSELRIIAPLQLEMYTSVFINFCKAFESYARHQGFKYVVVTYYQYNHILEKICQKHNQKITPSTIIKQLADELDSLGYRSTSDFYSDSVLKYLD